MKEVLRVKTREREKKRECNGNATDLVSLADVAPGLLEAGVEREGLLMRLDGFPGLPDRVQAEAQVVQREFHVHSISAGRQWRLRSSFEVL
jgi:hypothetical protein